MKLVFISTVTTPEVSATPSSPGLRAACAMATSSSVIETPPCATPHELVSSSRSVERDLGLAALEAQQLEAEHARRTGCGRGISWR